MRPADDETKALAETEAWLRELLREPTAAEIERAQLLAGLAVSQEWLAAKLHDPLPAGLMERVRKRVAAEADEVAEKTGLCRGWRQYRFAAGVLAAAAALAFAILPQRTDPFLFGGATATVALAQYRDDEIGQLVASLEEELNELVLAFGIDGSNLGFENSVEDISAWLSEVEDDWS